MLSWTTVYQLPDYCTPQVPSDNCSIRCSAGITSEALSDKAYSKK